MPSGLPPRRWSGGRRGVRLRKLLYRIRLDRIGLVLVGAVEPGAEVRSGFVGRLTVEGHHRGGHTRDPDDMGSPAFVRHPRHFDDEGASGDYFFKAVPHDDLRPIS